MSYFGSEMHKFVIGDLRTDGWKSQWRRDTEAWIEAHKYDKVTVTAPQIRSRQKRQPGQKRTTRHGSRQCEVCPTIIRKDNLSGRCILHKTRMAKTRREIVRLSMRKRRAKLKAEGMCVDCGKSKVKQNKTLCQACLTSRSTREEARQIRIYTRAA